MLKSIALGMIVVAGLLLSAVLAGAQETAQSEREAMYSRYLDFASYVTGGSVEPHWMADGSSFWYAEGAPENTVIYQIDPQAKPLTIFPDRPIARLAEGHEASFLVLEGNPLEDFDYVRRIRLAVKQGRIILRAPK